MKLSVYHYSRKDYKLIQTEEDGETNYFLLPDNKLSVVHLSDSKGKELLKESSTIEIDRTVDESQFKHYLLLYQFNYEALVEIIKYHHLEEYGLLVAKNSVVFFDTPNNFDCNPKPSLFMEFNTFQEAFEYVKDLVPTLYKAVDGSNRFGSFRLCTEDHKFIDTNLRRGFLEDGSGSMDEDTVKVYKPSPFIHLDTKDGSEDFLAFCLRFIDDEVKTWVDFKGTYLFTGDILTRKDGKWGIDTVSKGIVEISKDKYGLYTFEELEQMIERNQTLIHEMKNNIKDE